MPDLPETGGWEEWRRLVLSEQRRLGHDLRELTLEVRKLATASASATAFRDLEVRVTAAEQRIETLLDRIDTYRKTIAAVSLTLAAVILLPIARAWLTTKGGP